MCQVNTVTVHLETTLKNTYYSLAVYTSQRRLPDATKDSLPAGDSPWPGKSLTHWVSIHPFHHAGAVGFPGDQASPGALLRLFYESRKISTPRVST